MKKGNVMGSDFLHSPLSNDTPCLSSCDVNFFLNVIWDVNLQCCPSKYERVYKLKVNFVNSHYKRTKMECGYTKGEFENQLPL